MLKRLLPLSLLLLAGGLPLTAAAQAAAAKPVKPVVITFGKPEAADFEAKNFVADSAAPAVVLYDGGKTTFEVSDNQFHLETEHLTRIKILKKAGYYAATVQVPLYQHGSQTERLSNLRGFTYLQAGGQVEKTKLDPGQTFTENEDVTGRHKIIKFTLPNVREGAVIEYAYTITSSFLFQLQPWYFQRELPVRWSEFRATVPEYFQYKILALSSAPLAIQTQQASSAQYLLRQQGQSSGGGLTSGPLTRSTATGTLTAHTTNYHWAMQNAPALRAERYITTMRDYVAQLAFQLATIQMPGQDVRNVAGTWDKINYDLLQREDFGGQLDQAGFLAEAIRPLVAQYPEPAARAAAVRTLLMKQLAYDGHSAFYASGPLRRAYDLHRGSSADLNLLLIAALRQANLPAQPAVLSTRGHGHVLEGLTLLSQFNYVIGVLPLPDGSDLLLDATDPLLPCGMLPYRCLNGPARLVAPSGAMPRWVSLTASERRSHFQDVKLTVDAEGNLTGRVSDEYGGYTGAAVREKLQEVGEKKWVTELAGQHPTWEMPSYAISQVNEVGRPVRLTYELRQPASTAGPASELYLKPLQAFGEEKNPFAEAVRTYPVDFGAPTQDVIMLTLTLPAGYTAELPPPATVELPDQGGRYTYSATSPAPGTVQLLSRLTLSRPVYEAEQYESLREFYRLALSKQAEALVIKKQ